MKRSFGLVAAALLSLAVGCGDDDGGGGTSGAAGMSGMGGTGGASGMGGTGGASGMGGTGGTGGMGGTGGTGGGADRDTVCAAICTSIEALNCAAESADCAGDCAATWDETLCQSDTQALLVCSSTAPASAWACDEFDEAALTEGCVTEAEAVTTCILGSI